MSDYISKKEAMRRFVEESRKNNRNCIHINTIKRLMDDIDTLDEKEIIRKYEKKIMRFPTIEEMAKTIAEKALNEYEYEGKTIKQWVEIVKDYDDKKSTLERIVRKLEKEKSDWNYDYNVPINKAIKIVKEECGISE